MPAFEYTVSEDGQRREGVVEADNISEAADMLRQRGCVILSMEPTEQKTAGASGSGDSVWAMLTGIILIRGIHIEAMLRRLGALLHGGIPVVKAIEALREEAPARLAERMGGIAQRVRNGMPLSKSMKEETPFVGETTLGLMAVGEANGTLDEMLQEASRLMERSREIRSEILQAFSYPAVVTVGAIGVAIYMVHVVFPKVLKFIQSRNTNTQLPPISRALIAISEFMTTYGIYIFLAPIVLVVAFVLIRRTEKGGIAIDRAILQIPLIGKAARAANNAMWTRTLGTLLGSGVGISASFELLMRTVKNRHYKQQFRQVHRVVRRGQSVSSAVRQTDLDQLCPLVLPMISVGERTGQLDEALLQVARDSQDQLERRTNLLAKMVEPAIFVVVGGTVGFVYFAFFMAMMAATRSAT
ncbi:MAG: type II secretion system F family protein [Planctomycetota bacterium]